MVRTFKDEKDLEQYLDRVNASEEVIISEAKLAKEKPADPPVSKTNPIPLKVEDETLRHMLEVDARRQVTNPLARFILWVAIVGALLMGLGFLLSSKL